MNRPRPRPPMRALVITAVAAVVSGLGVTGLLLAARNGHHPTRPARYQRFRVGFATTLADEVRTAPVFFPDPRRGSRAFFLDLIDGQFVALHVLVPGQPRCVVGYDRTRHQFRDCHRHAVDPRTLERFPVTITGTGIDKVVEVDLRSILAPTGLPSTTVGATQTSA